MRWNWQLADWPDFRFDADRIRASEEQFLKGSGDTETADALEEVEEQRLAA